MALSISRLGRVERLACAPRFSYPRRMIKRLLFPLLGLAPALLASSADARPFRVSDIPNGGKYTCLNCHGDLKATYNTDFGSDARNYLIGTGTISSLHVDWTPLCPLDSDRDGWTNGEELGDPDCTWKSGDPDPKVMLLYNPGNPESAPPPVCGSGVLEAFEECEGTLLAYKNCFEVGAGEGLLGCTADCKFDYSNCSAPPGATPPPPPVDTSQDSGCSAAPKSVGTNDTKGAIVLVVMGLARSMRRRKNR